MENKKIFECAYRGCFGVELFKDPWPMKKEYYEEKFDKEMAEAYENPNLALKKLYSEKDYLKKRESNAFGQRKSYEKGQLENLQEREFVWSHFFVETAYKNGVEVEPELLDRFFASSENREALYAHYDEFMKENLDEAVQALIQGNLEKADDLQEEALLDTRFKDNELLYTVALCERMQKEYDSYDSNRNVESQRWPIPRSLHLLGKEISCLSDEEKSLIPGFVWNRLGNVVINETLNDYYETPDPGGLNLIHTNTMRLSDSVMNLLPDIAKYGSYDDPRLLNASLLVAYDTLSKNGYSYDKPQFCEGKIYERELLLSKGYRKEIKRSREQDLKKQNIQKRIEYLKNKGKEVSGVVIADKIAEGIQSGVIVDTVTPERGNKIAENIRRKLSQKSR